MEPILTPTQWLELPGEVRHRIATIFGLRKSEGVQVVDNRVVSDGHTVQNLQGINVATMQAYLNSKEKDFYALFNKLTEVVFKEVNNIPATAEVYEEKEVGSGDVEEAPVAPVEEPKLETNPNADVKVKKTKGTKSK